MSNAEDRQVRDVVNIEVVDGEVRARLGDAFRGLGIDADVPIFGNDGFISIPNLPTADESCQAFVFFEGDRGIVAGLKDNRFASKIGGGQPGDRFIVTDGEVRFIMKKEADSFAFYTVNQQTGQSMMVFGSGADGELHIVNGNARILIEDDRIVFKLVGSVAFEITPDGFFFTGPQFQARCPVGHLGQLGPGVPPVAPVNSILMGPTGIAGAPSVNWTVGL